MFTEESNSGHRLNFLAAIVGITIIALSVINIRAQTNRPSAAIQFRSITVVSEPNTNVWIDGVLFGKTDETGKLEMKTVAAGGHSLRFRADGFKEKSQPIAAGTRGEIKIALVKTTDEADLAYQEAERIGGSDREKSIAAYRKAIQIRSNYPEAYLALARSQSESGDFDDALKALVSARKLRPGYAEASAVEGRIHKENGDEDRAIAAFKRAITEGKGVQPEAFTGLGLLYKEKAEVFGSSGDFANENANYAEAAKYLKTAIKQLSGAPDAIIVYQLLGLVYERQQKLTEAISIYREFLRIFPDAAEASAVQSFIVQLQKQLDGKQ